MRDARATHARLHMAPQPRSLTPAPRAAALQALVASQTLLLLSCRGLLAVCVVANVVQFVQLLILEQALRELRR
jgi:hypothetical protein